MQNEAESVILEIAELLVASIEGQLEMKRIIQFLTQNCVIQIESKWENWGTVVNQLMYRQLFSAVNRKLRRAYLLQIHGA